MISILELYDDPALFDKSMSMDQINKRTNDAIDMLANRSSDYGFIDAIHPSVPPSDISVNTLDDDQKLEASISLRRIPWKQSTNNFSYFLNVPDNTSVENQFLRSHEVSELHKRLGQSRTPHFGYGIKIDSFGWSHASPQVLKDEDIIRDKIGESPSVTINNIDNDRQISEKFFSTRRPADDVEIKQLSNSLQKYYTDRLNTWETEERDVDWAEKVRDKNNPIHDKHPSRFSSTVTGTLDPNGRSVSVTEYTGPRGIKEIHQLHAKLHMNKLANNLQGTEFGDLIKPQVSNDSYLMQNQDQDQTPKDNSPKNSSKFLRNLGIASSIPISLGIANTVHNFYKKNKKESQK